MTTLSTLITLAIMNVRKRLTGAIKKSAILAAFEIYDSKTDETLYFVQPWDENTATEAWNDWSGVPGYSIQNIVGQYHTHPNSSGPSYDDANVSKKRRVPVYTVGADGQWWKSDYSDSI